MEQMLGILTNPAVMMFIVGVLAARWKSDLAIPEAMTTALNVYVLLAIGLKGGMGLAAVSWSDVVKPLGAALVLGMVLPLVAFMIGKWFRFSFAERISLAATYGSVSLVTFAAAITQLEATGLAYEGFMTTLVVVLEIPGLVVALWLYQRATAPKTSRDVVFGLVPQGSAQSGMLGLVTKSFLSKSILLLCAGLVVGLVGGEATNNLKPLFVDLFPGMLLLFLLGLGLKVGGHLDSIREYGWRLVAIGVTLPLVGSVLGYVAAQAAGLSDGGTVILMTLAASGSYIAAPAMLQASVPEAKPSFYLTMSLAVTFPFNLLIGIPLFIRFVTGM